MSGLNRKNRGHAVFGVALLALISGCASNMHGSEAPPFDWVADAPSNQCAALAGHYLAGGMPAPANAQAFGYGAVWPTEGSLLSIIERGTNANPRKRSHFDSAANPVDIVPSMSIFIDASGNAEFDAKNAKGGTEKLKPQVWTCEHGNLTSLAALNSPNFESYVRLWKHGDALIAEQVIRETNDHATGERVHRPVAWFHFRFPSTVD
jgi:hypothetical protein